MKTADVILEATTSVCLRARTTFKFLRSYEDFIARNSKSADRSASGKFVTVYPRSAEHFSEIVDELESELAGIAGPYILSDVRHRQGPLYFRYGGFQMLRKPGPLDESVPSLVDPSGNFSEDIRVPVFRYPQWAPVPHAVDDALSRRAGESGSPLDDFESINAIHFSNGGGVYEARTAQGVRTILKEARPYAGLDRHERDAAERLKQEAANLRALEDTGLVPKVLRTFMAGEHNFLELELVAGKTFSAWIVENYPFSQLRCEASALAYSAKVHKIVSQIAIGIEEAHRRGIVIGDLHPSNVMVDDSLAVRLIDLEDARTPNCMTSAPFNAFGYEAPAGVSAGASDWHGLARMTASAYYVPRSVEVLAPQFWLRATTWIRRRFGRSALDMIAYAETRSGVQIGAKTFFTPESKVGLHNESWSAALKSGTSRKLCEWIADGIMATVGMSTDRRILFPGDIQQYEGHGHLDIETGAGGVLLSLLRAGFIPELALVAKVETAVLESLHNMPLGLFRGAAGIGAVLHELGRHDVARTVFARVESKFESMRRLDLRDGLAGVGLALLALGEAAASAENVERAVRIGDTVASRLFDQPNDAMRSSLDEKGGLLYGWSGVALFLAELARATESERFLTLAHRALERDFRRAVRPTADSMYVNDRVSGRALPYLAWGSSGMLLPIANLRRLTGTSDLYEEQAVAIRAVCQGEVFAFAGLFNGRAGTIASLAYAVSADGGGDLIAHQVEMLGELALDWKAHLVFPGDNYVRLSTDLSTGAAGLLCALVAAETGTAPWLPVVGSLDWVRVASASGSVTWRTRAVGPSAMVQRSQVGQPAQ